jgi:adenylate kinase
MKVFLSRLDSYLGRVLSRLLLAGKHSLCGMIGDASSMTYVATHVTREIVSPQQDLEAYKNALLTSNIVVFEMEGMPDETAYAFKIVNAATYPDTKTFIAVSSVQSWAATQSEDPLTEDLYHKRVPTEAYKKHKEVEKLVTGGVKNPHLTSFVIFAGLMYGEGEGILHDLFKQAWLLDQPQLPLLGEGKNTIPMVHVRDLACCIVNLAVAETKPELRYLAAVDDANPTQEEVVTAISKVLGTGAAPQVVPLDQALAYAGSEYLLLNIKLSGSTLKDLEDVTTVAWKNASGFVENIRTIVAEYKAVRRLQPVRVVLDGLPSTGKTSIAMRLSRRLRVSHVHVKDAIATFAAEKPDLVPKDDNGAALAKWPENQVVRAVRYVLLKPKCRNHGYVLDGFPKTYRHARMLFKKMNTEEGGEGELDEDVEDISTAEGLDVNERIETEAERLLPELCVRLTADSDQVLQTRTMDNPHSVVRDGEDAQKRYERRVAAYKAAHTDLGDSPVHFFDVHQVRVVTVNTGSTAFETAQLPVLNAEFDEDVASNPNFQVVDKLAGQVEEALGGARNYGPSADEQLRIETHHRELVAAAEKAAADKAAAEASQLAKDEQERLAKEAAEQRRLAEMKDAERQILEERSKPLRRYLMEAVVPTLTRGLIEVCKLRPEDPIDYLAEYLFRHNPVEDDVEQ